MKLLDEADTNGLSVPRFRVRSGGEFMVFVWGTFDSSTVTIEIRPPQETEWFAPTELTFTEKGAKVVYLPAACEVAARLASAGGSTVVSARIDQ